MRFFFMSKNWIRIAAISVLLCIFIGIYISHGMAQQFTVPDLHRYWTAVIYHLLHSTTILILAFSSDSFIQSIYRNIISLCFLLGIVFFCGTLYLLIIFELSSVAFLTPVGGFAFIFGWITLFFSFLKR